MAAFPAPLIATGYGLAAFPAAGLAAAGHGLAALAVLWLGGAAGVLAITAAPPLARAFPRRTLCCRTFPCRPGPPGPHPETVAVRIRQRPYGLQG